MAKGDAEMAALVAAVDGDVEFEIDLGILVGRLRAKQERAIRDQEAATLLPLGWRVVAERFDVSKATVYNMNQRAQSKRRQVA
jgi:hypothetical protein